MTVSGRCRWRLHGTRRCTNVGTKGGNKRLCGLECLRTAVVVHSYCCCIIRGFFRLQRMWLVVRRRWCVTAVLAVAAFGHLSVVVAMVVFLLPHPSHPATQRDPLACAVILVVRGSKVETASTAVRLVVPPRRRPPRSPTPGLPPSTRGSARAGSQGWQRHHHDSSSMTVPVSGSTSRAGSGADESLGNKLGCCSCTCCHHQGSSLAASWLASSASFSSVSCSSCASRSKAASSLLLLFAVAACSSGRGSSKTSRQFPSSGCQSRGSSVPENSSSGSGSCGSFVVHTAAAAVHQSQGIQRRHQFRVAHGCFQNGGGCRCRRAMGSGSSSFVLHENRPRVVVVQGLLDRRRHLLRLEHKHVATVLSKVLIRRQWWSLADRLQRTGAERSRLVLYGQARTHRTKSWC